MNMMGNIFWMFAMHLMVICHVTSGARILIHPWTTGFNSRLLNMQKMADILQDGGHEVSILLSNKIMKYNIVKKAEVVQYNVPEEAFVLEDLDFIEMPKLGVLDYTERVRGFFTFTYEYCKGILSDRALMDDLKSRNFDLLVVEMFDECNRVLVSHFDVPAISYQNHGYALYTSLIFPHLYGMNCVTFGSDNCVQDAMTFQEKLKNIILTYLFNQLIPEARERYLTMAKDLGIKLHQDTNTVFEKNMVLLNADHVIHEPWPSMPNVFMISGIFNEPASPLPEKLKDFVEGSAPHGFIVFSFGTLVSSFKKDVAELFAKVFAKLPQRVVMRYKGQLDQRGNNTIASDWIPQSDLLSHPLARAFVTHCGISGTFEAAYKGVPVLAVPLFAEQKYNSHKLTVRRGMGIEVDFHHLDEEGLATALGEVVGNPKYKQNALETSKLLRANPIPPKQRFLHLVNYTIDTGGARHLIHDIGVQMTWYQKFALDVIVVVLAVFFTVLACVLVLLYCLISNVCCSRKSTKTKRKIS